MITGAANGLGRALACSFASQRILLGIIDVDSTELQVVAKICKAAGSQVVIGTVDVSDMSGMDTFVNSFHELFGSIDVLIANAGISPRLVLDHTSKMAQTLMLTNYIGMINTVEPAARIMETQRSGVIVVITSISKLVSTPNSGSYSASKSAASSYLKSLRQRLERSRIKVLEITLGFVDTEMNRGSPHAPYVMINVEFAAEKIIKAISKRRNERSIPFWRNAPWYILSIFPQKIQDYIIEKIRDWLVKQQKIKSKRK